MVPHTSPTEVYASEYYKKDLYKFKDRLGVDEAGFEAMIPHLWLPSYLKAKGYENNALVSLPVLNPATGINRDFDIFKLMPKHNDIPFRNRSGTGEHKFSYLLKVPVENISVSLRKYLLLSSLYHSRV